MSSPTPLSLDEDPLRTEAPGAWARLVEAVGPSSLLVVIEGRLGPLLRPHYSAEDLLQETLLAAWRKRESLEWRGVAAFRGLLVTLVTHRIQDLVKHHRAEKRGEGVAPLSLDAPSTDSTDVGLVLSPVASTTPSRAAHHREQARLMLRALASLPEELRDVVRLRLFEELTVERVATELELGVSAVKHRFLKGLKLYRERLRVELSGFSEGP